MYLRIFNSLRALGNYVMCSASLKMAGAKMFLLSAFFPVAVLILEVIFYRIMGNVVFHQESFC